MYRKIGLVLLILILVGIASWQSYQLVKAKQKASSDLKTLSTSIAISTFNSQYNQVLDKITIREVNNAEATVIYWTENLSASGKTMLHATAVVNGVVLEFPQVRDITDYLK